MMLFVDTTGRQLFLDLFNQQGLVTCKIVEDAGRHSSALIPAIQNLLQDQQVKMKDLTALAVVTGPGSFTGIRIGLSFVKGVSLALKIPVVTFSSLQMMALAHDFVEKPYCLAKIHARLEESYAAIYHQSIHSCVLSEGVYAHAVLDEEKVKFNSKLREVHSIQHHAGFHTQLYHLINDRLQQAKIQSSEAVQANYLRLASYQMQVINEKGVL